MFEIKDVKKMMIGFIIAGVIISVVMLLVNKQYAIIGAPFIAIALPIYIIVAWTERLDKR